MLRDDFCDLLDTLLSDDRDDVAAVLSAYFDASERGTGIVSVAGFAFGLDRAKKAQKAWKRLWGDTPCHMTDLHNRKGPFKHWTPEQGADRLKAVVSLIREYASYAVAVSCDAAEVAKLAPQDVKGGPESYLYAFRTPYAICSHMAMTVLGHYVQEYDPASRIAYFFESGDMHQAELGKFLAAVTEHRDNIDAYRYLSHTFIGKRDARILEMADVFAWEWAKHQERGREGKGVRPSLHALLNGSSPGSRAFQTHCTHITGWPLERCYRKLGALRQAKTVDDCFDAVR